MRSFILIQINYKSGKSMKFWVSSFSANTKGSTIVEAAWTTVGLPDDQEAIKRRRGDISARHFVRPLHLNVDAIESIWTVDQMEVS